MRIRRLLPEMLRREPGRVIVARTEVPPSPPPAAASDVVVDALRAFGAGGIAVGRAGIEATVGWRTLVLGVVAREVDEEVGVSVAAGTVIVRCRPRSTHSAHAAGAAVVIAVAAATWLLTRQLLPAATTLVAGLLLVDVTRELALTAFERRLTRLAQDLSVALWPTAPPSTSVARIPD